MRADGVRPETRKRKTCRRVSRGFFPISGHILTPKIANMEWKDSIWGPPAEMTAEMAEFERVTRQHRIDREHKRHNRLYFSFLRFSGCKTRC